MIEFDGEEVDIGQDVNHPIGPVSQVGEVADPDRPGAPLGPRFEAKAECWADAMGQRERLQVHAVGQQEGAIVLERPDQALLPQDAEFGVPRQRFVVLFVAEERNLPLVELPEGIGIDVVAVRVGQEGQGDLLSQLDPTLARRARRASRGPIPEIQEQPRPSSLDQGPSSLLSRCIGPQTGPTSRRHDLRVRVTCSVSGGFLS